MGGHPAPADPSREEESRLVQGHQDISKLPPDAFKFPNLNNARCGVETESLRGFVFKTLPIGRDLDDVPTNLTCMLDRQVSSWEEPYWENTTGAVTQPSASLSDMAAPSLCSKTTLPSEAPEDRDQPLQLVHPVSVMIPGVAKLERLANGQSVATTSNNPATLGYTGVGPFHAHGFRHGANSPQEALSRTWTQADKTSVPSCLMVPCEESDVDSDVETTDEDPTTAEYSSSPCLTPYPHNDTSPPSANSSDIGSPRPSRVQSGIVRSLAWILSSRSVARDVLLRALMANDGADQGTATSSSGMNTSSGEQSTGSDSRSSASGKRPWVFSQPDRAGNDGMDEDPNKRFCSDPVLKIAPTNRLACPFQKLRGLTPIHCGMKTSRRRRGGFENFSRVRTHVLNQHNPELWCSKCWDKFKDKDTAQQHRSSNRCRPVAEPCPEMLLQHEQVKELETLKLRGRASSLDSDAEKWYELMEYLLPCFPALRTGGIRECYNAYYEPYPVTDPTPLHILSQSEATASTMLQPCQIQGFSSSSGSEPPIPSDTANSGFLDQLTNITEDTTAFNWDQPMEGLDLLDQQLWDPSPSQLVPTAEDSQGLLLSQLRENNQDLRTDVERYRQTVNDARRHASQLSELHERLAVEMMRRDDASGTITEAFAVTRTLMRVLG